jgi:pyrimidine deaminase RibD-like protein
MQTNIPEHIRTAVIEAAAKSKANKRKVGAVIVDSTGRILAAACNHNPTGACERPDGTTYDSTIHAEVACIQEYLDTYFSDIQPDCKMYVSHQPCKNCLKVMGGSLNDIEYEVVTDFMKFDAGKLRYDLIPPSALKGLAEVLTFGAKKYKPNNWRGVDDPDKYVAATMRHFEDYRAGQELDTDSSLAHLKHAMTNIAFLLELQYVPSKIE